MMCSVPIGSTRVARLRLACRELPINPLKPAHVGVQGKS